MSDQNTRTPDLMAAIGGQSQDPASIIDSMRSQGSFPTSALMALMQGSMGASPAAIALAGSANPGGQNPLLAQQTQQQMMMMKLIQDMGRQREKQQEKQQALEEKKREFEIRQKERKEDRENAANESILRIGSSLFTHEGTEEQGAAFLGEALKKMGREVPSSILGGVASKRLKPKDYDSMIVDIQGLHYTDEAVLRKYPNATPQDIQDIKNLPKSPTLAKLINAPDDDEVKKRALDIRLKEAQVFEAEHPELKGDPRLTQLVLRTHQDLYGDSYTKGTSDQQQRAYHMAVLKQNEDETKKLIEHETIKNKIAAQFREPRAEKPVKYVGDDAAATWVNKKGETAPSEMPADEARSKGFFRITNKEFLDLGFARQAFVILQNLSDTEKDMEANHLFVESAGLKGLLEQGKITAKRYVGDPKVSKRLLGTWDSQASQMVILLRQLGDKGVRAIRAFEPAMNALQTGMGAESVKQVLSQVEAEVRGIATSTRTPDAIGSIPTVFKSPYVPTPDGRKLQVIDKATKRRMVIELEPNETLDESRYQVAQ